MLRIFITVLLWASIALGQTSETGLRPVRAPEQGVALARGSIKATLANPAFHRILVAGHRGSLLNAPENTIASFERAVAMGADIIELDARLTKDGHWVVFHDSTVHRITGQNGPIETRTLEEVRQLRINVAQFPAQRDLRILTLEEALDFLKNKAITYIDHKSGPALLLAKELQRLHATDRAYIVARTPQWAAELRAAGPDIHIMGALNDDDPESFIRLYLDSRPTLMELPKKYLTPENVALMRKNGVRVFTNALTFEERNQYDEFQALIYRGADAIQTDHLEWLVPYLKPFNAR